MNAPSRDPSGPVVAVCAGSRCNALRRMKGDGDIDALRDAVRATAGGMLVTCGCLGRCDLAAVVMVCWRGEVGVPSIPLAGMDDATRVAALAGWLPGPGPRDVLLRGARLPEPLAQARLDAEDTR